MSRLTGFNHRRLFSLLLLLIITCTACSRLGPGSTGSPSDLALLTQLSQAQYRRGEPVLAQVTLGNTSGAPITAPQLDHTTVAFTVRPQLPGSPGDLKFVEPVYSSKEEAGRMIRLPAAGDASSSSTSTRQFAFTTLTFEPGTYVLATVYSQPSVNPAKPARKTYAKAVVFTVASTEVYAHRYVNGLLSREDAVKLASARAGAPVRSADTLLITDEAGFYRWWVNLRLEAKPGNGGEEIRSYFVDTTFPRVWKEARPFTAADQGVAQPAPQDAQSLQRLKEQSIQKRVK